MLSHKLAPILLVAHLAGVSAEDCPSITTGVTTVKIGDLEQGSEFTKCIKITDFNSKSLGDEVQVVDKDATTGCCPACWIPGMQWYKNYWSSMIVCGFKDDGSVSMTMSSSNDAKTCTYNKCYVVKMDITCKDSSKMTLDGCCPKNQWTADCKMYSKSKSFFKEKVSYCLSYTKKYKLEGTTEKTDDQAGGKLALSTIKAYTGCAPFSPGVASGGNPAPAPAPSGSSNQFSYQLVGDAACVDSAGSHGTGNLKFSKTTDSSNPHTNCQTKCSADATCTGYDSRPSGCLYYKITIVGSNEAATNYQCYRKTTYSATQAPSKQEASPAMQASLGVFGLVGAAVSILM